MADDRRADDRQDRAFGDLEAAADAFEHLPVQLVVTEGPELTVVAANAAARAITDGRLVLGKPIVETLPRELTDQGWPEASCTARPGPDGSPRGTIVVLNDVTERVLRRTAAERDLEELRGRYAVARDGAQAMQRALLPDSVPVVPSFDVAARYVLATDEQGAGGDWFDVVEREDGSLVLVVGDVVGHGRSAAVAMGQLRSVLLAQLRAGSPTAEAVQFLDGFAASVRAARRATVCIASIDEDGTVEYCTAGHVPPLVLEVGGPTDGSAGGPTEEASTRYLPPSGAGPLGTGSAFPTATAQLPAGAAIVLYSDGILERPGTTPAAAAAALATTASDAQRDVVMPAGAPSSAAERICAQTIELLTRTSGYSDDITILAAQRRAAVAELDVEFDAAPDAVQHARSAVRAWLLGVGISDDGVAALLHAVTELVANVIGHAYLGAQPEPFRVRGRLENTSEISIDVVDRGSWKLPVVTLRRGRGLALVRELVDVLQIQRGEHGTTASLRRSVSRRAGPLDRPMERAAPDPEHFDVWVKADPEPTISVVGPLDAGNAVEARSHLDLALTEASATVTVDLSRVTLLTSAGADPLFRVIEQARALGLDVDLVAPNGSPAQHVLSLVRLTHSTRSPG